MAALFLRFRVHFIPQTSHWQACNQRLLCAMLRHQHHYPTWEIG